MPSDIFEPSPSSGPKTSSIQTSSSQLSVSALASRLRLSLKTCTTSRAIAVEVLNHVMRHLSPTVVRVDFREGAQTRIEINFSDSVSAAMAARLSEQWLNPLAVEVQTDTQHSAKSMLSPREDLSVSAFSAPILDDASGLAEGAISILIAGPPPQADLILTLTDAFASAASTRLSELAGRIPAVTVSHEIKPAPAVSSSADQTWDASFARMAHNRSPLEFAFSLVNSLVVSLGAEQVGFGMHDAQRMKVLALSGVADFKPGSSGVALIQQSMDECLDHGRLIVQQNGMTGPDGTQFAIHRRWSSETGNSNLCSIPLTDADGIVAVVSIRRSASHPFTAAEITTLLQSLKPYGSALRVLERGTQSFSQQLKSAFRDKLASVNSSGSVRRWVAALLCVAALWCVFGSVTYTPLCRARVIAKNMVQMTSTLDSRLLNVHVQAGDHVRAGQLLAEFDMTDQAMKLASLERDIVASEVDVRRAIEVRDAGGAALAKARVGVLKAQADAVKFKLAGSRLTAPADGVIVRADLNQRIGQTFRMGEVVLEFAPAGGWILEIQVPDDIGSLVRTDQTGAFAAESRTSTSLPFVIESVNGTAQVIDGGNVFVAHAPLTGQADWLKSGMEGTAKVVTVSKPVLWVAFHRVVDWCRLNFWI
jgi:hypothetical protein